MLLFATEFSASILFVFVVIASAISSVTCQKEGSSRVIGGHAATYDKAYFYAQVQVHETDPKNNSNSIVGRCGGTFISEYFVLTAAHCAPDPSAMAYLTVYVIDANFTHNLMDRKDRFLKAEEISVHDDYLTVELTLHHKFFIYYVSNDIAILKLDKPVDRSRVLPLCGPSIGPINSGMFVVGMGVDAWLPNGSHGPPVLMEASMTEELGCSKYISGMLQKSFGNKYVKYQMDNLEPNTKVCVSSPNGTGCYGDSGGALVVDSGSQKCLYGIVSYGANRCPIGETVLYTRVASYLGWISEFMAQ